MPGGWVEIGNHPVAPKGRSSIARGASPWNEIQRHHCKAPRGAAERWGVRLSFFDFRFGFPHVIVPIPFALAGLVPRDAMRHGSATAQTADRTRARVRFRFIRGTTRREYPFGVAHRFRAASHSKEGPASLKSSAIAQLHSSLLVAWSRRNVFHKMVSCSSVLVGSAQRHKP